jgi:alpha-glucosidase (family GH31 glycosyl hydrolase)
MRLPPLPMYELIRSVILVGLGCLGVFQSACAVEAAKAAEPDVSITREDGRSFQLAQRGSPPVGITFLTAESFRIHVISDDPDETRVPKYMVVKAAASYPAVDVRVRSRPNGGTFLTSAVMVRISIHEGTISLNVRTPTKVPIENWTIYSCCRTARLDLRANEHIYGFGDKRTALDQRGWRVQMLNRDAFASETNYSYKSIPFYMSTAGYGLFFHNFYPTTFDLGVFTKHPIAIQAPGGDMDFYVFVGDLKHVLSQYTELTGRPAMLPRWAFGYQQGKASYEGREAFSVAAEMRRRKLPLDAIYYDDWSEEATRKDFVRSLRARYHVRLTMGFGMPMFGRFGKTDDSALLKELASHGFLMVDQDNQPAIGSAPQVDEDDQRSSVGYLDWFSPKAVDYVFTAKWDRAIANGVILGMVDFGEMDNIPFLAQRFWPSLGLSVAKTRNLLSLVYPLAVVGGTMQRTGGRSTGMVRAGFAGTQRLGWATTGDSLPTYQNWRAHLRGLLNLTLSGFSNVGQDIGGWDSEGPDVLYARWFAAGTFFPFMWSHGQGDHEPYSHGRVVENAARKFLDLRYRLIPYLYSLHERAHATGIPMLRAFPLQAPGDPNASRIDDEYFVGDDVLVAPIFNDEGNREVYLPEGFWYDFFDEHPPISGSRVVRRKSVPLDRIPVYVRAGAIITLGPVMQYTAEKLVDPLSVDIFCFPKQDLGATARTSEFALYEDDGISTAYRHGAFVRSSLRLEQTLNSIKFAVRSTSGDGSYRSVAARSYRLRFHGVSGLVDRVHVDGKEIRRNQTGNHDGAAAGWAFNPATRSVLIYIPRSSERHFDLELFLLPN